MALFNINCITYIYIILYCVPSFLNGFILYLSYAFTIVNFTILSIITYLKGYCKVWSVNFKLIKFFWC